MKWKWELSGSKAGRTQVPLGLKDVLPSSLEDMCIRDDCISHTGNVFDEERTIEDVQC
jgi:hypothetical protein